MTAGAVRDVLQEIDVDRLVGQVCQVAESRVLRERGEEAVLAPCPIGGCKGDKFSINRRTGAWNCPKCGERGNALQLAQRFGLVPVQAARGAAPRRPAAPVVNRLSQGTVDAQYASWKKGLRDNDGVRTFLKRRGLQSAVADALGFCAKTERGRDWLGFPYFRPSARLAFIKWRSVEGKDLSRSPTKAVMPTPVVNPLFNGHAIDLTKPLVITEGELDAATFWQLGWRNVVSVSNGAGHWDDAWTAQLATAEQILIAVDHDESGNTLAEKLRQIFGAERVARISLLPHKDANAALMGGWGLSEFDSAVAGARREPPEILRHAREIAAELAELARAGRRPERLDTGHLHLDRTQRGLRPGELTVLTAHTGAGKTAFTLDMALRLAERDVPVCFLSMEQGVRATVEQLMGMVRRCAFEDMHPDAVEAAAAGVPACFFVGAEPSRDRLEQVVAAIRYAAIVHQVRFVVVDHLDYLIDTQLQESRYAAATRAVKAMQAAARDYELHLVLICQPTTASGRSQSGRERPIQLADIAETRVARQLPHNGWLWSSNKAEKTSQLHVAKARHGPAREGITIEFKFDGFRFQETGIRAGGGPR